MMKYFKLWTALLITVAAITTLNAETKRYEVKSGIIEYTITHVGNVMGMAVNGKGIAKTVFKEWGNVELHSEEVHSSTMGMKEIERQMTKIDNGKLFVVDFDEKVIYEYTPETLMNSEYQDFAKTGNEMIESMNGKKIGEEKIMGYTCEVWEMMQVKVWLHKGIMLKSEAEMMGIKHTTVATKIDLDVSISKDDLKLPNFPLKSAADRRGLDGEENSNEIPQLTPEQMEQMQEMMKNFSTK